MLGTMQICRPWKLSNFQDSPPSLSSYVQNSSTSLTLDVQFQTISPPRPSPNDNQSIKRKHNPRMTIICYQVRSFLQVGFCFQYQLSNLSGFLLTSFHLALANLCPQSYFKKLRTSFLPSSYSKKMCWGQGGAEASLSAFSLLCFFVCAVVQKYYKIFFIYNYSHF